MDTKAAPHPIIQHLLGATENERFVHWMCPYQIYPLTLNGRTLMIRDPDGDFMTKAECESLFSSILDVYETDAQGIKVLNDDLNANHPSVVTHTAKDVSGFVYLAKAGPHYKIGVSIDPKTRIKSLSSPYPVELIHTIAAEDMIDIETSLHLRFDDKRLNSEWFDLDPADVEYIKGL